MEHSHKAGSLRQVNKSHKQVKASKRSNKQSLGGRVESGNRLSIKEKTQNRKDRLNEQRQLRENKRKEFIQKRRAGAGNAFPSAVALIPLGENVDTRILLKKILDACSDCSIRYSSLGQDGIGQPVTVVLPKFKSRLTFLCCTQNLENVLDTCKIADICLFVCDASAGEELVISSQADLIFTTLRNQGLPTSMGVIQNLEAIANQKQRSNMKKFCSRLYQTELNPDCKVFEDSRLDLLLRALCECSPSVLHWRQLRAYMLGEEVTIVPDASLEEANLPVCDICVRGYVRGGPFTVYDFVHITGEESHKLAYVKVLSDPSPVKVNHLTTEDQLIVRDPLRECELREEEEVDMSQVCPPQWPTPTEELEDHGTIRNTEAIWQEIVGDELYEDEDDRREHMALAELEEESEVEIEDELDAEDAEDYARQQRLHKNDVMSLEERRERENEYFEAPDEVEVPLEQPARYRFIKYRGLQSFRSSPWDPKENLPVEYATLTDFPGFESMQKSALELQEKRVKSDGVIEWENEDGVVRDEVVRAGDYVEIRVQGVNRQWLASCVRSLPLLVSWLLPYEEKLTVVHSTVQRSSTWSPDPLKSRDLLSIHMGFRHMLIHPLFAEGSERCDKCKYVQWVPPTGFIQMVFYAPMNYRPCPLTVFQPRESQEEDLRVVAVGSVTKASTDTVVLKKVILTGSPFKVRRKLATVRHMFYEPRDILWFKPVELHTRLGLVGHIREPLGTHGYMKCIFNDQLSMNDEVRMALYKRVFPKKCTEEEKTHYI